MNFRLQGISNVGMYSFKMDKKQALPAEKNTSFDSAPQKQEYELQKFANLNKGIVSFSGFKLDDYDREFLDDISQTFGVSKDVRKNLEKTLTNFLKENDFTSISDMAGDDFSAEQSLLLNSLNTVLKLDGDNFQKLVDMIICYIDFEPDDADDPLEIALFERVLKNFMAQIKKNDTACLDSICHTFNFNDEQKKRLYEIVYNTLHEYELKSMKSLENDDNIEVEAVIQDRIAQEFNLSEDDGLIVSAAFSQRIFSDEDYYIPLTNPLDRNFERCSKDNAIFASILSKYDLYNFDETRLHAAMKHDAYNAGFESIFDLFNQNNDFKSFKETNEVLNSQRFLPIKTDLLIDFNVANKKQEEILENISKSGHERGERYKKAIAIICNLDNKIDLSSKDVDKIRCYLMDSDADFRTNPAKAAYELSEIINKENSFDKIHATIKEISEIPNDKMKNYGFEYCELVMNKKSQS